VGGRPSSFPQLWKNLWKKIRLFGHRFWRQRLLFGLPDLTPPWKDQGSTQKGKPKQETCNE